MKSLKLKFWGCIKTWKCNLKKKEPWLWAELSVEIDKIKCSIFSNLHLSRPCSFLIYLPQRRLLSRSARNFRKPLIDTTDSSVSLARDFNWVFGLKASELLEMVNPPNFCRAIKIPNQNPGVLRLQVLLRLRVEVFEFEVPRNCF